MRNPFKNFFGSSDDDEEFDVHEFHFAGHSTEETASRISELNDELRETYEKLKQERNPEQERQLMIKATKIRRKAANIIINDLDSEMIENLELFIEEALSDEPSKVDVDYKVVLGFQKAFEFMIKHRDEIKTDDHLAKLMLLSDSLVSKYVQDQEDREFFSRLRVADDDEDAES